MHDKVMITMLRPFHFDLSFKVGYKIGIVKTSVMALQFLILPLLLSSQLVNCYFKLEIAEKLQQLGNVAVDKTVGQVWPLPQQIQTQETTLSLDPQSFVFINTDQCDIIQSAFYRYYDIIFNPPRAPKRMAQVKSKLNNQKSKPFSQLRGELSNLEVIFTGPCETWPSLDMDEQYQLKIDTAEYPQQAQLIAVTPWGVLRGLETFSQLVYFDKASGMYLVNSTLIVDFPRFSYRGILIDTARHFVPKHILFENLDAMAYNKMNVLHWHIVDDQSFPYSSRQFPEMSEKGAYVPETHIYTFDDIAEIMDYARLRGIRVVPEYDTPGHTLSWGDSHPELLTQCYASDGTPNGLGPMNPSVESTFTFLQDFFAEVSGLYNDQYVHLGGDEVAYDCWDSNPEVKNFTQQMNFTDYGQLEGYYMSRLIDIVGSLNYSYIVWQEVVDNGGKVKSDTVVEVWLDNFLEELSKVTGMGLRAILASCWYLDYISYGSDWKEYYQCEPQAFNGTQQQNDLVVGGEACLWGEYVDSTNLIARMWPRASSAGERLWSNQSITDINAATPRLEEHRCRMLTRGINAEPQNGPSFCEADYLL